MIKPKKSLGQHFLSDETIARNIVNGLNALKEDWVIEIGPGTGALTHMLADAYEHFESYEVDERAIAYLVEQRPGLVIHHQNFLETNLASLARQKQSKLFLIGNLPYFLTSPILFHTIDIGSLVGQAVYMIQKEVATRLVASPGTKDYGILSVQAQALGTVDVLFHVSRNAFSPPPKVESSVISYIPGNTWYPESVSDLPVSLSLFKNVVRTAFQQRRKKLSNALKPIVSGGFPPGFDSGRRAEELTPKEFVDLASFIERAG